MPIRIHVQDHEQAAAVWRAMAHVPPELVPPAEIWLDDHGYLWTLRSVDGQLGALREAPMGRTRPQVAGG